MDGTTADSKGSQNWILKDCDLELIEVTAFIRGILTGIPPE
jgi:hypothetical protein